MLILYRFYTSIKNSKKDMQQHACITEHKIPRLNPHGDNKMR